MTATEMETRLVALEKTVSAIGIQISRMQHGVEPMMDSEVAKAREYRVKILALVIKLTGFPAERINGVERTPGVVAARHLTRWAMHSELGYALKATGFIMECSSSMVCWSSHHVERRAKIDPMFSETVERLRELVGEME